MVAAVHQRRNDVPLEVAERDLKSMLHQLHKDNQCRDEKLEVIGEHARGAKDGIGKLIFLVAIAILLLLALVGIFIYHYHLW